MLRTVLWYIYLWLYQVVSLTFFVPLLFLRLLRLTESETIYVRFITRSWARSMIWAAGGTVIFIDRSNRRAAAQVILTIRPPVDTAPLNDT